MKRATKINIRIIAACSVAIFSLAALFGGSYAWFVLTMSQTAQSEQFAVVNLGQCELFSAKLIKFDYSSTTYGTGEYQFTAIDYLNPENGDVNKYNYNETTNSFGYEKASEWVSVQAMNVYDPIDSVIFGSTLKDLNCNAIYEFTVVSDDMLAASLNSTISKIIETVKQDDEIFLSTCVNFDLFTQADLSNDNPAFIEEDDPETVEVESGIKAYYPSYIDKSETLSINEEIYYKLSYLASLKSSHSHFYGGAGNEINLVSNKDVDFVYDSEVGKNVLTFYVNVDYAPSELGYTQSIIYLGNIRAVYDFSFKFNFVGRSENE